MEALTIYFVSILLFSILFFILLLFIPLSFVRILVVIYMWTPTLASLIALRGRRSDIKKLLGKFNLVWYLSSPIVVLLHLILSYLIFRPWWVNPENVLFVLRGSTRPISIMLVEGIAVGLTINALIALGEEIGWRGFLYNYVEGNNFVKSVVIGTVWAWWHWPLISLGYLNFPESKVLGLIPFTFTLIPLTYILLVFRERGGVWACAALHGTVNALLGLEFLAFFQVPDYLRPPSGLMGGLIWLLEAIVLFTFERISVTRRMDPGKDRVLA